MARETVAALGGRLIFARMLSSLSSLSQRTHILLLVGLAFFTYAGTLGNAFVFDDTSVVRDNKAFLLGDLSTLLVSDYWAGYHGDQSGLYRPLTMLSYALQLRMGSTEPLPYHLINCLLHAACAAVLYLLMRQWSSVPSTSFLAAALFAVHPAYSESICAVVGRADLMAAAFCLLAILFHIQSTPRYAAGTSLCIALALLCKESAIALLALLPLVDLFQYRSFSRKCYSRSYLAYAAVVVLYLALRYRVLGAWTIGHIDPFDNPLVDATGPMRLYDALAIACRYVGLMIFPAHLSADYSHAALPLSTHVSAVQLSALVSGCAALGSLLYWGFIRNPLFFLGLGWFCLAFAPVSNLFFPIGTIMAERVLYLPAIGFCIALTVLLQHIRRGAPLIGLALVALLAVRSAARTQDWRDELSLFTATAQTQPQSARAWRGLGLAALERNQLDLGRTHLQRALDIYPGYYEVYADLAQHALSKGQPALARRHLARCLELRADYTPAWFSLGVALYHLGENDQAVRAFEQALKLDPHYAEAMYNMGVIALESGQRVRALSLFERTLALDPSHANARINLNALKK